MSAIFAIISVILALLAGPNYLLDIIKGRTKPQRATWFIFSLLGVTAFIAQLQLGGRWSLLFTGVDALGCLVTFALSVKYGVGGFGLLDRYALSVAAVGLVTSLVIKQPILAICGVILADCAGNWLTIMKVYRAPASESTVSWAFQTVAAACAVAAVGKLDFSLLLYPGYLTLAIGSILVSQYFGYRRQRISVQA